MENQGVIALAEELVLVGDVRVVGNHHRVTFDTDSGAPEPDPVRVFAPSLGDGYRAFPADPTKPGVEFTGWWLGTTSFDQHTALPGTSTDGEPVTHTLRAHYGAYDIDLGSGDGATELAAGDELTFTPTLTNADSPVPTDPSDWTVEGDRLNADLDPDAGQVTVRGEVAGEHTVTVSYRSGEIDLSAELDITVVPAAVEQLVLEASATEADVGDTIEITAEGFDAFGNAHGDLTDQIELTSDVETDVVESNTVTFTTASPHTITATHLPTGVTAQVVVEVDPVVEDEPEPVVEDADPVGEEPDEKPRATEPAGGRSSPSTETRDPAPAPSGALPLTGASGGVPATLGLALLLCGAVLVASARRSREAGLSDLG